MRSTSITQWSRAIATMLPIAVAACEPASPLTWDAVQTVPGEIGPTSVLVVHGDGHAMLDPSPGDSVATRGPVCAGSIRIAGDGQGGLFAAWWAPREDSNAVLVVARRAAADSGRWTAPVIADARDQGRAGCGRPAPGIAADAARGYVHLAYYLEAPTGAGVYGGHSMESGTYFHDPVAIVYGDRPVAAAIATSGDLAAVAYEDPNSARSRVAIAISLTAGHVYEHRLEASTSSMRATNPRVAAAGRRIAVAWTAEEWEQGTQSARSMMRIGTLGDDIEPGTGGSEE